jgi:hypothetical protein
MSRTKTTVAAFALLASGILAASVSADAPKPGSAPAQATPSPQEQARMKRYTPALRERLMKLAPETKATLRQLEGQHPRKSESATMRQVMQEILSDYLSMAAGVAADNAEQAADSARRLANHRIPKGGLVAYIPLEKITDANLATLPAFNDVVEGGALKLAVAAEKGDMPTAAVLLGEVLAGCVGCHQRFRGVPGTSPHLVGEKAHSAAAQR